MSVVVSEMATRLGVTTFLETGTYQGDATRWAASVFKRVFTIELNPDFFRASQEKLKSCGNVEMHLGDSAKILGELVDRLDAPSVFWLDAHSGGGNHGDQDYCPLLSELEAINRSVYPHFIIIDDARAFVAPVPLPFDRKCWPPIDEVIRALQVKFRYHIAILNDAIFAVPPEHEEFFVHLSTTLRPSI